MTLKIFRICEKYNIKLEKYRFEKSNKKWKIWRTVILHESRDSGAFKSRCYKALIEGSKK